MCNFLTFLCIFSVLGSWSVTTQAQPVEKEKVRPYQFGFTIDEQQHRYEKRDERGIVMGEFGFITADGIYHVTVYATDEEGKFRILAMKSYPYESPPKTIEMIVKPKPKPSVITSTARAIVEQKLVPKHNFYNEACSGCFLGNGNGSPKSEDPKLVADRMKSGIRPLSKPLGPEKTPTASATPAKGKVQGKYVAVSVEGASNNIAVTQVAIRHTNTPTTTEVKDTVPTPTPTQQHTPIEVSAKVSATTIISPTGNQASVRHTQASTTTTIVAPQQTSQVVAVSAVSKASESRPVESLPTHTTPTQTLPNASQKSGTEATIPQTERLTTPTVTAAELITTTTAATSIVPVSAVQENNSLLPNEIEDSPIRIALSATTLTPPITHPPPTESPQTAASPLTTIQSPTTLLPTFSPIITPISTQTTPSPTTSSSPTTQTSNNLSPPTTFSSPTTVSPPTTISPTTTSPPPTTLLAPTSLSPPTTPTQSPTTSPAPPPTRTTDHIGSDPDTNLSVDFNSAPSAAKIASSPASSAKGFGAGSAAQTPTASGSVAGSKGPATSGNNGPVTTTTTTGNKGVFAGTTTAAAKGVAAPQTPSTNARPGAPSGGFGGKSSGAGGSTAAVGSIGAGGGGGAAGGGAGGRAGSSGSGGESGDLYRFKYTLDYNGHSETGSRNGNKEGKFFALGDDNVERTIEYIANEFGFQPRIRWRRLDASNVKPKENSLKDYEFVWFKKD